MNRLIPVLVVVGIFVVIIGGFAAMYVGANNTAIRYETAIEKANEQRKNSLSSYSTGIAEAAQVPSMYVEDFKATLETALAARYGEDGVDGTLVAIQEAYPGTLDPALYTNIQNAIRAGRANFANSQTDLLDRVREYQTALGTIPTGFFMSLAGYPRIDFDDYEVIVDEHTQSVFSTKTDQVIKLR